jgi:hypothetical protein
MEAPKPVTGTSDQASWLNKLLRFVVSLRLQPGRGYKVRHTTSGTILDIEGLGGSVGPQLKVKQFRVTDIKGDYLVCREWNGTTEGGTDINIAKPYKLRNSITSEKIDGLTINYSYAPSFVSRTASATGYTSETHIVNPPWLKKNVADGFGGDIVYAVKSDNGTGVAVGGVAVEYVAVDDGRAWAKVTTA